MSRANIVNSFIKDKGEDTMILMNDIYIYNNSNISYFYVSK